MKYTINLDKDNYILSLAHTPNDDMELDISTIETKYLTCYFYNKDTCEAILDESRKIAQVQKEEQQAIEEEIAELKKKLADTDYIYNCIREGGHDESYYAATIEERKAWRKRIQELQNK